MIAASTLQNYYFFIENVASFQKKFCLQRISILRKVMAREDRNLLGFTVALITEFAQYYGVHPGKKLPMMAM